MCFFYFKKNDAVQLEAVLKWLDAEDLWKEKQGKCQNLHNRFLITV